MNLSASFTKICYLFCIFFRQISQLAVIRDLVQDESFDDFNFITFLKLIAKKHSQANVSAIVKKFFLI